MNPKYTVKELHDGAINKVTTSGGLYIVRMPKGYRFKVLSETQGRKLTSKGKKSEYPVRRLNDKIVQVYGSDREYTNDILYIGQTSHSVGLQERVSEYLGFRYDEPTNPHDGGRALWQLDGNEDFVFELIQCKADEVPEDIEHEMLLKYKSDYGNYPIANWRS